MLVAEHQRQVAEGDSVEPEPLTLRQDLFVQPQSTREAA
jgi:hypothetical protein